MPRRKQPQGEGRKKVLQIKLTDEELASIEAAAKFEGNGRCTWARCVLLWESKKRPPATSFAELLGRGSLDPKLHAWAEKLSRRSQPTMRDYRIEYRVLRQKRGNDKVLDFIARILGKTRQELDRDPLIRCPDDLPEYIPKPNFR